MNVTFNNFFRAKPGVACYTGGMNDGIDTLRDIASALLVFSLLVVASYWMMAL